MSDETPTVRFEQQEPPVAPESATKKSRRLILILSIVGGLLLIAVIIFLTLLFSRGLVGPADDGRPVPGTSTSPSVSPSASPSETPSPSPSPSSSPSESPSTSPPPTTSTSIDSFTANTNSVLCNTQTSVPQPIYISFKWKTTNVSQVGFGVASNDGISSGMGFNLPPSGNSTDDFPPGQNQIEFPCPSASQFYTLTVMGPDGKFSKSVTVTNNGDRQ